MYGCFVSTSESDLRLIPVFDLEQAQTARDTPLAAHLSPPPDTPIAIFGAGLPPVPSKLLQKIESMQFIEIAELLLEKLAFSEFEEDADKGKGKKRLVTSILNWAQCFSPYAAIISRKHPERVPDLLGYQSLIIDAQRQFRGDHGMGYSRRFRHRAAATGKNNNWADIDVTVWSLAFVNKDTESRYKFCFSTSHGANSCPLAKDSQPPPGIMQGFQLNSSRSMTSRKRVRFKWNESPMPNCSRRDCAYEHVCYLCYRDPTVANKYHKAIQCGKWQPGLQQRPIILRPY